MRVAAVVLERRARRLRHRLVEDELLPVRAPLHRQKRLRHAVVQPLLPLKAGRHVQQMPDGDGLLAVVEIRDGPGWKKLQHATIQAVEQSILECNGDQGTGHGLGSRIDAMLVAAAERRVIGFSDDPAVPCHQQAVHLFRCAEFYQIGKRVGVHPLRFRRRRFPRPGRPSRGVLRHCVTRPIKQPAQGCNQYYRRRRPSMHRQAPCSQDALGF